MTTWKWRRRRTTTAARTSPGRGCRPQTRYGRAGASRSGRARRGRRRGGQQATSPQRVCHAGRRRLLGLSLGLDRGLVPQKNNPGSGSFSTGGQFCPRGTVGSVWGQFWLSQVGGTTSVGGRRPGGPPDTSQCAGRPPAGDDPAQRVGNVDVATCSLETSHRQGRGRGTRV